MSAQEIHEQQKPAQRGAATLRWAVLACAVAVLVLWPLARLFSQAPPPRTPARVRCLEECQAYRRILVTYWRGADTAGRLAILHRWLAEGPAWIDRIAGSGALVGEEVGLATQAKASMAQYNTAPPTGPSQAGLAAGALIAIAQRLERLEASLGR